MDQRRPMTADRTAARTAADETPGRDDPSELYDDPFAGTCRHARDLPPRLRAERTRLCPRCGPLAGRAASERAGCILEGIELESRLLESGA